MQSEAAGVAEYLAEIPEERRAVLTKLRGLCLKALKGYSEGMDYGMPCYKRDGAMVVAFASQKQYVSLYGVRGDTATAYRKELKMAPKGCMRFKDAAKIDLAKIKLILEETAKLGAGC